MHFMRGGMVGTLVAGLATVFITRFQDIAAHAALMWPSIVLACLFVSLMFSWSWTQAFKRFFIKVDLKTPPSPGLGSLADMQAVRDKWLAEVDAAKSRIYACAMVTCAVPAMASVCVLWLFPMPLVFRVVFTILWLIVTLAWSAASPWLWRQFFEGFWPWLMMVEKQEQHE